MELRIFENLVRNGAYEQLRAAKGETVEANGIVYRITDVCEDNVTLRPIGFNKKVHPDWTMESFMLSLATYENCNVAYPWRFSTQRRMIMECTRSVWQDAFRDVVREAVSKAGPVGV